MIRITSDYMIYNDAESNLNDAFNHVATLQQQITTNDRIPSAEADPIGMGQITLLQSKLDSLEQGSQNAIMAQSELQTEQSQLNNYASVLNNINQLIMKASSNTTSAQDMKFDAIQLSQYLNQIVSIANTKNQNNNSIFAGTNTATDAYAVAKDAQGNITGVTYQGNDNQQQVNLGSGVSVNIYQSGNTVFGSGANSVFSNLVTFIQRLQTGAPLTTTETTAELGAISGFQATNTSNITAVDNQSSLANFEVSLTNSLKNNYLNMLSSVKDTDITTATTELAKQKNILQETILVTEQLSKLSAFGQD